MSDSKNQPPNDEWIKSLYRSAKENEDVIPESIDASILAKAREPRQTRTINRFQSNLWRYGTAATAVLGIMLILQIPDNEVQFLLAPKDAISQAQTSKAKPESITKTPVAMAADSDVNFEYSIAPTIEPVPVYARRITVEISDQAEGLTSAKSTDKLPDKLLANTRSASLGFTSEQSLSDAISSDLSHCTRLSAYFTNIVEKQAIVQCETDAQLSFQFEKESGATCKEIFYFVLKSTATVSTRKRDPESGVQEIQIDTAGKRYSLFCEAGEWILTALSGSYKQP